MLQEVFLEEFILCKRSMIESLLFFIFSSEVRFKNFNEIGLPESKILLT